MQRILTFSLNTVVFAFFCSSSTFAQDIRYTQYNATPLAVNPAFTGMTNGGMRASALYRNQWASTSVPFLTYGASFDMPVYTSKKGDYVGAGLQDFKDRAGDGNLSNFSSMLSIAYHKSFGKVGNKDGRPDCDLAIGGQVAHMVRSLDLNKLYFSGNNYVTPSPHPYYFMDDIPDYFAVNVGLSFLQRVNSRFNYVVGVTGSNLNQPSDNVTEDRYQRLGVGRTFSGQFEANLLLNKWTIRPSVLITQNVFIFGSEFKYRVGKIDHNNLSTAVFLGGWYRTGSFSTITGGVEYKRFKLGIGVDYFTGGTGLSSNRGGGAEISLCYLSPAMRKRIKK